MSNIYLDDEGNYRDRAPEPTEDGEGVQITGEPGQDGEPTTLGDGTADGGEGGQSSEDPTATKATAKTRKQ